MMHMCLIGLSRCTKGKWVQIQSTVDEYLVLIQKPSTTYVLGEIIYLKKIAAFIGIFEIFICVFLVFLFYTDS